MERGCSVDAGWRSASVERGRTRFETLRGERKEGRGLRKASGAEEENRGMHYQGSATQRPVKIGCFAPDVGRSGRRRATPESGRWIPGWRRAPSRHPSPRRDKSQAEVQAMISAMAVDAQHRLQRDIRWACRLSGTRCRDRKFSLQGVAFDSLRTGSLSAKKKARKIRAF